jgi:hypothetical protein
MEINSRQRTRRCIQPTTSAAELLLCCLGDLVRRQATTNSAEKAFVVGSPTSGESETTRFRNQKKSIRGVFEPLSLRMVIATPRVSKSLTADVQSVGYALDFWLVVSASAMGTL